MHWSNSKSGCLATAKTLTMLLIVFSSLTLAQEMGDAESYFKRGDVFLQSKQLDEAVAQFKHAVRIKPNWAEAYFKLGEAYSATPLTDRSYSEKHKAALNAFEQASRLKPEWAEAHYEVGRKSSGDVAIESYKKAIRLKPELTAAHEALALAYLYQKKNQPAISSLLTAVRLEPNRPLPHKLLGLVYLIVDERKKAVSEYELLKSLDPEMADYLNKAILSRTKPTFGIESGRLISVPAPHYPEEARKLGISGSVTVALVINEKGIVTEARATNGPSELRSAAEAAALKARFKPTKLSGQAVSVNGVITINFVR